MPSNHAEPRSPRSTASRISFDEMGAAAMGSGGPSSGGPPLWRGSGEDKPAVKDVRSRFRWSKNRVYPFLSHATGRRPRQYSPCVKGLASADIPLSGHWAGAGLYFGGPFAVATPIPVPSFSSLASSRPVAHAAKAPSTRPGAPGDSPDCGAVRPFRLGSRALSGSEPCLSSPSRMCQLGAAFFMQTSGARAPARRG